MRSSDGLSIAVLMICHFIFDRADQIRGFLKRNQNPLQLPLGLGEMVVDKPLGGGILPVLGDLCKRFSPIVQRVLNASFGAD